MSGLFGQSSTTINMSNYDDKPIHYGFLLALNHTNLKVTHSQQFIETDTFTSIKPVGSLGFALGFVFNLRISEYFDARLLPTVSFYERTLRFQSPNGGFKDATFESSIIELPFLMKYKSERRKNNRMYMVAGIKPAIEVGAKKDENQRDELILSSFDLALEYGLGTDIYYPLFKFAPEIRFSLGLRNLFIKQKDNLFSQNLAGLSTYTVTFLLLFE
jgi:hypothetical protein